MDDKFLSRKFILSIFILVSRTVFVATGSIEYEIWMELVKWVFGFYALGNGIEHVSKNLSGKIKKYKPIHQRQKAS